MHGLLSVQRSQPLSLAYKTVMPLVLTGPTPHQELPDASLFSIGNALLTYLNEQMQSLLAVRAAIDLCNAQSRILLSFYNKWEVGHLPVWALRSSLRQCAAPDAQASPQSATAQHAAGEHYCALP